MTEQTGGLDQEQIRRMAEWLEQVRQAMEKVAEAFTALVERVREAVEAFAAAMVQWARREMILWAWLDYSPIRLRFKRRYQAVVWWVVTRLPERWVNRLWPVALRLEARKWGAA